jgi:hypothetical protein
VLAHADQQSPMLAQSANPLPPLLTRMYRARVPRHQHRKSVVLRFARNAPAALLRAAASSLSRAVFDNFFQSFARFGVHFYFHARQPSRQLLISKLITESEGRFQVTSHPVIWKRTFSCDVRVSRGAMEHSITASVLYHAIRTRAFFALICFRAKCIATAAAASNSTAVRIMLPRPWLSASPNSMKPAFNIHWIPHESAT